jgi:hypothetical protein
MATKPAIAPGTAPNLSSNLMRVLSLPWLDRTIGLKADSQRCHRTGHKSQRSNSTTR